jgi:hypothetical protein
VPWFEGGAEFGGDAAVGERADEREAEFEVRGEPCGVEVEAGVVEE